MSSYRAVSCLCLLLTILKVPKSLLLSIECYKALLLPRCVLESVMLIPCLNCCTARPPRPCCVVLSSSCCSECIDKSCTKCDLVVIQVECMLAPALMIPLRLSPLLNLGYLFFYSFLLLLKYWYSSCTMFKKSPSLISVVFLISACSYPSSSYLLV
jgi:hypothetical protein